MNKRKLAVIAGSLLIYTSITAVARAEEAAATGSDAELEEVVVTAEKLKEVGPVKITVVDEEQIKAQGARNVAEALKDVPGLYITSNDAQGKAIAQFRGSDAENTRVFVDGIPLSPVGDGKIDLSAIPAETIEKIEVFKGVAPVIYGTNAPGGIIYITTKKAGNKTAQAVTASIGSHRAESQVATVTGQTGRLSYLVNVKQGHTDGYTANNESKEHYFSGKLNYDFNLRASLTLLGSSEEKRYQIPNRIDPATGLIYVGELGDASSANYWANTFNWKYDPWENKYVAAVYKQKLAGNSDMSLKFYRTNENSSLLGYGWVYGDTPQKWRHTDTDGTVNGWELQHTIRTSGSNTVTWGYAYETRDYGQISDVIRSWEDPDSKETKYYTTKNHAYYDYTGKSFYLQDEVNINRRLAVNVGYRHDDISDCGHDIYIPGKLHPLPDRRGEDKADKPQISFNYKLTDRTFLHGAVGESYRWPNFTERIHPGGIYGLTNKYRQFNVDPDTGKPLDRPTYYFLWPDGKWHLTSEFSKECTYVLPEEAINRELGLSHTFPFGLQLDFTYFSKSIKNMIKGQHNGYQDDEDLAYYNIPNTEMHGFEVEASHQIGKRLKGFCSYSYTNAWDTLLRRQVSDVSPHKYSVGLIYTGKDGVNTYLSMNYVGSYLTLFSTGNGNGGGEDCLLKAEKIPEYRTVDLKVSKQINNSEEYYVRVTNLLDKKYYSGFYLVGPGRSVEMGATFKF